VVDKKTPLLKSFSIANDVLRQLSRHIRHNPETGAYQCGLADVRTIMQNTGKAVMGTGVGNGEGAAVEAAKKAISNPLLESRILKAPGASSLILRVDLPFPSVMCRRPPPLSMTLPMRTQR